MFVSDDWELFARWDMVFGDDDIFANDEYTEITLGANYYIHKHAAKFTIDLVWALDETFGRPPTPPPVAACSTPRRGSVRDPRPVPARLLSWAERQTV